MKKEDILKEIDELVKKVDKKIKNKEIRGINCVTFRNPYFPYTQGVKGTIAINKDIKVQIFCEKKDNNKQPYSLITIDFYNNKHSYNKKTRSVFIGEAESGAVIERIGNTLEGISQQAHEKPQDDTELLEALQVIRDYNDQKEPIDSINMLI